MVTRDIGPFFTTEKSHAVMTHTGEHRGGRAAAPVTLTSPFIVTIRLLVLQDSSLCLVLPGEKSIQCGPKAITEATGATSSSEAPIASIANSCTSEVSVGRSQCPGQGRWGPQ